MSKPYTILGVRIDAMTMQEAADTIIARASDHHKPACYVIKPYVEFLDTANNSPAIRQTLNAAWLSLPDGVSLQWAITFLYGGPHSLRRALWLLAQIIVRPAVVARLVPEKFGGANFTWRLLEACADRNLSVYLIGTPHQSSINVTERVIKQRLPKLHITGSCPGELEGLQGAALRIALHRESPENCLVEKLQRSAADIILVGMGFPLQEELMAKVSPQLKHGVLIGEGGTFDYESFGGIRRKAPEAIQNIGLEWLWRLLLEPKRLKRQLAIPRFIWAVYMEGKHKGRNGPST